MLICFQEDSVTIPETLKPLSCLCLQLTYKADSNQVGFLQLLSKGASQNMTYHCRNSVAYFDAVKRTYRKGIKLMTWNDAEITPRGNQRFRYDVGEDECRVSSQYSVRTLSNFLIHRNPMIHAPMFKAESLYAMSLRNFLCISCYLCNYPTSTLIYLFCASRTMWRENEQLF
jgi:hypothetical protein